VLALHRDRIPASLTGAAFPVL